MLFLKNSLEVQFVIWENLVPLALPMREIMIRFPELVTTTAGKQFQLSVPWYRKQTTILTIIPIRVI